MGEKINYQEMMEKILGEKEKPEIEPDSENPGSFRIKRPNEQTRTETIKEDQYRQTEIKKKPAPMTDYKQITFEADAIEAAEQEEWINKTLRGDDIGEAKHQYYDIEAKPIEFPTELKVNKKRRPPSDSHELKFE